jgi:hypothetical protein
VILLLSVFATGVSMAEVVGGWNEGVVAGGGFSSRLLGSVSVETPEATGAIAESVFATLKSSAMSLAAFSLALSDRFTAFAAVLLATTI